MSSAMEDMLKEPKAIEAMAKQTAEDNGPGKSIDEMLARFEQRRQEGTKPKTCPPTTIVSSVLGTNDAQPAVTCTACAAKALQETIPVSENRIGFSSTYKNNNTQPINSHAKDQSQLEELTKPDTASLPLPSSSSISTTSSVSSSAASTTPTLDRTSLSTSKHHPDFRVRNQLKILTLSTILSDLQLALSAVQQAQDQAAFDSLYARVTKLGGGLASVAEPALVSSKDAAARKLIGREISEVHRSMNKGQGEWYEVKHGGLVEEGEEHEKLSSERMRIARYVYEAGLEGTEALAEETIDEAETDGGVGLGFDRKWEDESQEATLVESMENLALLHPTVSEALLDGSGW